MTDVCPNGCGPLWIIWWVPGYPIDGIRFRPVAHCRRCGFAAYERQPSELR